MARLREPGLFLLLASLCAGCAHTGGGPAAPLPPGSPTLPENEARSASEAPSKPEAAARPSAREGLAAASGFVPDGPLSFEQFVTLAAASNPDLAIARAQVEAA